jgi:hypothetical protein
VIAARALDKCRAEILGWQGEYHYACPLSHYFLDYACIDDQEFKEFVATGATDAEVAEWISKKALAREPLEIVLWNNSWREKRIGEMSESTQLFLEDYIKDALPPHSRPYTYFDVYDIEEKRLPSLIALSD